MERFSPEGETSLPFRTNYGAVLSGLQAISPAVAAVLLSLFSVNISKINPLLIKSFLALYPRPKGPGFTAFVDKVMHLY